jgi:predicted HicB family RNase H-like nuclease
MAIAKKPGAQRAETVIRNDERAAEAFIANAGKTAQEPEDEGRKVPVTMRYDPDILKRVDIAAKRLGISRSAYVHVALSRALEQEL